jgi:hypothetical protein
MSQRKLPASSVNAAISENPSGYKKSTAIISAAGATSNRYFNEGA